MTKNMLLILIPVITAHLDQSKMQTRWSNTLVACALYGVWPRDSTGKGGLYVQKPVIAILTPAKWVCHYQFVFLSFTMDEKAASSIAFRVHHLTHPNATDPASFLWEPSPAGVISGHNHSLDTHNIAVTKTTTRRGMTTV